MVIQSTKFSLSHRLILFQPFDGFDHSVSAAARAKTSKPQSTRVFFIRFA
jgi:hypothetical protein